MLAWALIYIIILDNKPVIQEYNYYPDMDTCFEARESLKRSLTTDDFFPIGSQVICVQHLLTNF